MLYPVGQVIRVRITLPYNLGEVSAEARIVWLSYQAHNHSSGPDGMGISFIGPFS
jgi:hypothetical protein